MSSFKLKSRVVLVIVLTVLLVMLTIVSSTYSWFNRPNNLTGNALSYNPTVNCYDGAGVTVSTKRSTTGLEDSYTYTNLRSSSHSLAAGERDYYRTTLQNSTTTDQYVSLYLSDLKTTAGTGKLCVGVNSPVKSYKNFSVRAAAQAASSSPTSATNTMRLYFQPKDVSENGWNGGSYYVYYSNHGISWSGSTPSGGDYREMQLSPTAGTYFYDIPSDITDFFISVKDWTYNNQHTKVYNVSSIGLSGTQSVVVYLAGNNQYEGTNIKSSSAPVSGSHVVNHYSSVSIRKGDSLPISLASGTDYIGSVSYSSSNTSVFTVSNGYLIAKGVGTAVLTMKTKGSSYHDYSPDYTCNVNVTSESAAATFTKNDAPILQNIKVPAKSNGIVGETVVDWFIMNDKDASGSVTFEFSSLYVGV